MEDKIMLTGLLVAIYQKTGPYEVDKVMATRRFPAVIAFVCGIYVRSCYANCEANSSDRT